MEIARNWIESPRWWMQESSSRSSRKYFRLPVHVKPSSTVLDRTRLAKSYSRLTIRFRRRSSPRFDYVHRLRILHVPKRAATMESMDALVRLSCKAILFDMDGTLVDSTCIVEQAWGWWAARHNLPLETVLTFSHGRPTIATMEHFFPARDHTEELNEMDRYEETNLDGIGAVPGAAQIVR